MRWVEYIFPANARKSPLVESQSVVLPVYHHFLAFTIIVPTLSQQISTFVHEDKNKNIMLLSYIWYFIASLWRCFYHNWYSKCNHTTKYDLGYHLQFLWFFSSPGQLNRWPCQSLTEWHTLISEQWHYSDTTVTLQWHYSDNTVTLQWH